MNYETLDNDQLQRQIAAHLGWVEADAFCWITPDGHLKDFEYYRWTTDANLALTLVQLGVEDFELSKVPQGWHATVWELKGPPETHWHKPYVGLHEQPARAICLAWLRYQDRPR